MEQQRFDLEELPANPTLMHVMVGIAKIQVSLQALAERHDRTYELATDTDKRVDAIEDRLIVIDGRLTGFDSHETRLATLETAATGTPDPEKHFTPAEVQQARLRRQMFGRALTIVLSLIGACGGIATLIHILHP